MTRTPERVKPLEIRPSWRPSPDPPDPCQLTARDLDLFQWLADWHYSTTHQLLSLLDFPSFGALTTRVSALHRAGYVTSVRMRWPEHSVTAVHALTTAGGRMLVDYVPGWAERHRDWQSPVNKPAFRHSMRHELGRNAIILAAHAEGQRRGAPVTLWPDTGGTIRAQVPQTGTWINLTPDAVIDVNGQPWYLEYERSWRRDTLQHKVHQFGVLLRHEFWRERWVRPPKLLVVADEAENDQGYRLDTWLQEMDAARLNALAYLPAAAVMAGQWQATIWSAAGEPKVVDWWTIAGRTVPLSRPVIRRRR